MVEIAEATHTGRVRDHNEDRSLALPGLLAVADGMGGAQAGEVAAEMAIDHLRELGTPSDGASIVAAIERANRAIVSAAREDRAKAGMGTTVTSVSAQDGTLRIAHVGDSRAYLWRDRDLRRLTSDHSVVAELLRQGRITEEQAAGHPHRNVITRALGADESVAIDSFDQPARDGDVVLLCSDGLCGQLSDDEIATVLGRESDLSAAATVLVEQANAAGGVDNVTVVLARLSSAGPETTEIPIARHEDAPATQRTESPRGSRLSPLALAVVVLSAIAIGGVSWLWSRSFSVEERSGEVVVVRGLGPQIGGLPPRVVWQETGLDAAAVEAVEPASLSGDTQGRGEAVLDAARLIWSYGVTEPAQIALPRAPASSRNARP